ncbi:MAG: hypothetical protein OIF50_13715 [Flavobacteriaceae bacterium]|nr:hypothetical protein [Flavobacteriaceae bacterium]
MEELDLLKKDWQAKKHTASPLSGTDIKRMLHSRSSSIVKYILIISLLELLFPYLILLISAFTGYNNPETDLLKAIRLEPFYIAINIIAHIVAIYFIYLFYINYKNIRLDSDVKTLMKIILKTRKVVKTYILISLCLIMVLWIIFTAAIYIDLGSANSFIGQLHPELLSENNPNIRYIYSIIVLLFGILAIAFIAGLYFLMYGILLRKLKNNYRELKQLEI